MCMDNKKVEKIINEYYSKKMNNNDYVLHLDEKVEISVVNVSDNLVQKVFDDKVSTGYNLYSTPYKVVSEESVKSLSHNNIHIKFF